MMITLQTQEKPSAETFSPFEERLIGIIRDHHGPVSSAYLSDYLNMSQRTVRWYLARLEKAGQIQREGVKKGWKRPAQRAAGHLPPSPPALPPPQPPAPTFNLAAALAGRVRSSHTHRHYFQWIDRFLTYAAGMEPTVGAARMERMESLPIEPTCSILNAPTLRAWLGALAGAGGSKSVLTVARSSIVTLGSLLAEAGWLDDYTCMAMRNVRAPAAPGGQRPGRWLSLDEIKLLMAACHEANTPHARLRDEMLIMILSTMALRREEITVARWGDLSVENNRPVLQVHGKGAKIGYVDIPGPVFQLMARWAEATTPGGAPPPESPVLRRLWKGRIGAGGLTPCAIALIVRDTAARAGLGHVTPHDLRRSVAGALQESGVSIDSISRLLRHSNVAITERYLSRLPQPNDGAIEMSLLLGLEGE